MQVDWHKCSGNVWCELNKIDTDHKYLRGVDGILIIWSGEDKNVLKVSIGKIRNEIIKCKKDITIQAFAHLGLFITWTDDVPMLKKNAVYSYLVTELKPKFIEVISKKSPLKVNYPW